MDLRRNKVLSITGLNKRHKKNQLQQANFDLLLFQYKQYVNKQLLILVERI